MWTYHPHLLARAVPRYTSYPTAADFTDAVSHEDMARALDAVEPAQDVSLYLHIPFCRSICWYCGCNTGAANRTARLDGYLDRLHAELELVAKQLRGRGRLTRIAFGGGSPNAIAPAAFMDLIRRIEELFDTSRAVRSVEIDPRGFDEAWADALWGVGITHASLGVQTFDPTLQAAIGRVQPAEEIVRATALLRQAGVGSINFDLMYGLPGQDSATLSATIDAALALAPERLAVFGYAHVPHLVPRQRQIDARALPDVRTRFDQAALAHARLTRAGYRAVGFDHFAVPDDPLAEAAAAGTLRRNFQGYTDDQAEVLIGIGASAISQFPDRLLQNEKNTGRWHAALAGGRFATARGIRRTAQDRVRARAIEALLCAGTADLADIPEQGRLATRLLPFETLGLVRWQGTRLLLAAEARPYARSIAATLDSYREENAAHFSNAV
ncbi:oxygen-independent coproporphyrinogen III oxidase [Sphingomonas aracearum]|uniref:Coproporphyrinogen-III oxidase n=1 Tax=Sphingomonas aracearum TaxID=2283317 RepID=A0A369VRH3_9SPHN|nr:oxygen-independent coproporphyrinogen III oxidase [Sphingomonas aracearum]RDE04974.1 oxygen-independent coproporphyrinogen III oxidase [Sphingomonas aracearum]